MKKHYLSPSSDAVRLTPEYSLLVTASGNVEDYEIVSPYAMGGVLTPDSFGPLC